LGLGVEALEELAVAVECGDLEHDAREVGIDRPTIVEPLAGELRRLVSERAMLALVGDKREQGLTEEPGVVVLVRGRGHSQRQGALGEERADEAGVVGYERLGNEMI